VESLAAVFVSGALRIEPLAGLFPPNFSAATALAFCGGRLFCGRDGVVAAAGHDAGTDVALTCFIFYHVAPLGSYLLLNYAIYAGLIGLGKWFGRRAAFFKNCCSAVWPAAVIFYLVTNTLSWLQDPAYAKTIAGWIQALTTGRLDVHPTTWEMFRNTLGSGGLFTALFAGAAKLTAPAESPRRKRSRRARAQKTKLKPNRRRRGCET